MTENPASLTSPATDTADRGGSCCSAFAELQQAAQEAAARRAAARDAEAPATQTAAPDEARSPHSA